MSLRSLYDSELFSTQQEGVGTIWLIATLGSKSVHKRISRKEIMTLSIPKVCRTISHPQKDLALRFASNLMYGVALVYKQQIEYFYADATVIKTRLSRDLYSRISMETFQGQELVEIQGVEERIQPRMLINDDENFNIAIGLLPPTLDVDLRKIENEIFKDDLQAEVISKQVQNFDDVEMPDDLDLNFVGEDLVLDFGDLERRSSRINSRQVTPIGGDNDFLQEFDLGNSNNNLEPVMAQEANLSNTIVVLEPSAVPLPKLKIKNAKTFKIQIDNPIHMSTADLKDCNNDYIANQVREISTQYRDKIASLDFGSIRSLSIEEFTRTDFRFKMNWDLPPSTSDVITEISDDPSRGRKRSSSVLSIERARRMSQQSMSRSRSNSDFFHMLSQLDFMAGMELNDGVEFEPVFEENNVDDVLQFQETGQGDLNEFVEFMNNLKSELVSNSREPIVKFKDLLGLNESRKNVVNIFMKLLECASRDKCKLRDLSNGEFEILLM